MGVMKYRRLGRTGLKVSVVGLGTSQFSGEWGKDFSQTEVDRILGRAKELGINFIDTAECYGDHLSESLIGQTLRRDRDSWLIATKFGHRYIGRPGGEELWQPADVLKQLEASLRALQTDRIDLYQFHSGNDDVFDNDELWAMLAQQVELGKIGYLGISISSVIDPALQISKAAEVGASVIQVVYNRLDRGAEEAVFPSCVEGDLGVLARVPLASGFLSGKYKPGQAFEKSNDPRSSLQQSGIDDRLRQVQDIQKDEVPAGTEMAGWALAWCLQHRAITCVIPGTKTVEQLEANASAVGLDLVRDDHPQAWQ